MNKKIILALFLAMFVASASAQSTSNAVEAGATPGDLFYGLDKFGDQMKVAVASVQGPDAKAKAHARIAEERAAEAQKLVEENDTENVGKAVALFQVQNERAREAIQNSTSEETAEEVENRTRNSKEVLERVESRVPVEAQEGIQTAIDNSQKSLEEIQERRQKGGFKPKNAGKPDDVPSGNAP